MSPRAQQISLEWYGLGYQHGIEAGRRAQVADDEAAWERMRHTIRATADTPPYDVLADRRGQHDRAETHRALLRERGIAHV